MIFIFASQKSNQKNSSSNSNKNIIWKLKLLYGICFEYMKAKAL